MGSAFMSLAFRLWRWFLFFSYGPSRISVECLPSPLHWRGVNPQLSFQCWATVDISTQHFQASSCCFLLSSLAFSPGTCAAQESAKDLNVCMQILGLQPVAPFSIEFPCSILSLSERPGFWFWLSGQQDGPLAWESPPGPWALGRALGQWGSQHMCFPSFKVWISSCSCLLLVPLQWFYIFV